MIKQNNISKKKSFNNSNVFNIIPVFLLIIAGFTSCKKEEKKKDVKKQGKTVKVVKKTGEKTVKKTNKTVKKVVKKQINPFFSEKYNTPFEIPPFSKIKDDHYSPAFLKGMKDHKKEIELIVKDKTTPTFENTIEKLELSGDLLNRVASVFYNLASADTNDNLKKIKKEITPLISKHNDEIKFNKGLFIKIKAINDKIEKSKLTNEQKVVVKKYYEEFVRGGALLKKEDQTKLAGFNKELTKLKIKYNDNLMDEIKNFKMVITKKEDLAGLPQSVIDNAAQTAKSMKMAGKWVFTLNKPSWIPFLQYSTKRELREKLYKGYINKGNKDGKTDNKKIISRIAALRVKKANILGFKNFAAYVLDINMAKKPVKVYELLNKLWKAALPNAKKELKALQALVKKDGGKFKIQSWDWWYYSEKLRKEKYALDDEILRPYFKLENVRNGVFYVAKKLWGLKFKERTDLPKYHKDVKTFEVIDKDGKFIGIYIVDYFPRPGKRGGAWMNSYRKQIVKKGKHVYPIIVNVCNFTKPVGKKPSLLSYDEVTTLFHEFGHAMHGLLSKCTYNKISGTDVPRDFVELPSQLMEHWAGEPEVLKVYAKHYKTGKVIPKELIEKIKKSSLFNQGFGTTEYLAAAFLDMQWHTMEKPIEVDTNKFENDYLTKLGLIPEIISRYRSTYFMHITGGYAAGYYSYIWAAVLDNDAYAAFKEKGDIFHPETAKKYRDFILSKGSSENVMVLYKKFRGAEPKIEPLLKHRGLK
jgi:peptidyl-dipeptidase Dcp